MNFPSRGFLLDILKGSVCTVALFLAYASIPLLGVFGGLLAPLPSVYFSLRTGKYTGGAIIVVSALLLGLLADGRVLLLYLLQVATVSLLLPYFLGKKGIAAAIALTGAASLAIMVAAGLLLAQSAGVNLDTEVQKWLSSGMAQTASLYSKSGLKEDDIKALQQGLQQAGSVMVRVYPALLAISQGMVVIMTVLAIAGFVRRGKISLEMGEFKEFRNHEYLIWALIISGFGMLIQQDEAARVALNIFLIVVFAYFFQGLAVMAHFFTRFAVPAFGRFMFYFFLLLQPYLLAGVAVLGIFDLWVHFRTPRQQNL